MLKETIPSGYRLMSYRKKYTVRTIPTVAGERSKTYVKHQKCGLISNATRNLLKEIPRHPGYHDINAIQKQC